MDFLTWVSENAEYVTDLNKYIFMEDDNSVVLTYERL